LKGGKNEMDELDLAPARDPDGLKSRIEYLERELEASAQAFAILRSALAVLSRHVVRHSAALQVIGPIVEDLAGGSLSTDRDADNSRRASEEIAELKKMFEKDTAS
jgi:hypothetical protein